MKICRVFVAFVILLTASRRFAGAEISSETAIALNPPRFEVAVESGYLFGVINPPQDYEIGALFVTGPVRCGGLEFLQAERPLECGRRHPIPASLLWRGERSEPEFESSWSTSCSRLLLLSWRKSLVFQ